MFESKTSRGYRWNVWLAIWASPILSILLVLLYILILDQDIPSIKPRPTLENAAACIVYVAHIGNVVAAVVLAGALLQEEFNLLLVWMCWSVVQIVLVIILVVLSFFTLLKHKPARIGLHILCAVMSLWALLTVLRIYKYRDSNYDWQDGGRFGSMGGIKSKPKKPKSVQQPAADFNGHTNDISGNESGIL